MKWNLKSTSRWAVRVVSSFAVAIPTTQSLCKDDKKDDKDDFPHDVAVYFSADSKDALKAHLGNTDKGFSLFIMLLCRTSNVVIMLLVN